MKKIFIARGKSALRNSLRGNEQKYSSGESICRYSSQVGLPKLVELLEKNELAEDQLKLFLLLNAEAISKGVFRAYPELEKMVSKYK